MKILKIIVLLLLVLIGALSAFMSFWPSFGASVSGERLKTAEASSHFHDGKFANTVPQAPYAVGQAWDLLKKQFGGNEQRVPPSPIPVTEIADGFFEELNRDVLRAVWLGHASVYLEIDGLRLLTDPALSDYASPLQGIGPERFHASPVALDNMPRIDAVLISHDHYDHLDMATVQHLAAKGSHFFVPLGAGAHLEKWGVAAAQVTELEWGQSAEIGKLKIISTEARHYSGRGIFDHKDTFWTSWTMVGSKHRAFYSGDTGFSDHFARIGNKYGPFDLNIIKIGAYGPGASWTDIHMTAEDSVRAHLALNAKRMFPVHWATFNLAFHDWDEPIKRTMAAVKDTTIELVTPRIGEVVTAGETFQSTNWWEAVNAGPRKN